MLANFSDRPKKKRGKFPPVIIRQKDLLGFLELSTDEQIAKKIYEATGDKVFKGFLPLTWNTARVTKMKDIFQQLKAAGTLSAQNMAYRAPEISIDAHRYFIENWQKIKPPIPLALDQFKPLLYIAGAGIAAIILIQVMPLITPLFKKRAPAPEQPPL